MIELRQLAPFPLPSHPDALGRVPAPVAVKEIEGVVRLRSVARIQRAHTIDGGAENLLIALFVLGGGVGVVAENSEVEVSLAVGEILHLDSLEAVGHAV